MFFIGNQIGINDGMSKGASTSITNTTDLPGGKIILIYIVSAYLLVNIAN